MKKNLIFILVFIFLILNVFANNSTDSYSGLEDDQKKIQDTVDKLPIDEQTGGLDKEEFEGYKSKAEERIEKINNYVGPVTNILFNHKFDLSWIFLFAVICWLLIAEFIAGPLQDIFGVNSLLSVLIALIVSSIAMQGFGENLTTWLSSIGSAWYISLVIVFIMIIVGIVYGMFMKFFGKKMEEAKENAAKDQTDKDRQIIHTDANISEKRLESYMQDN